MHRRLTAVAIGNKERNNQSVGNKGQKILEYGKPKLKYANLNGFSIKRIRTLKT
jgi:hypothetical protein